MTSAGEVVTDTRDNISKMQRKAFSAVLARAQVKRCQGATLQENPKAEEPNVRNIADLTRPVLWSDTPHIDPLMRQDEHYRG